MSELDTFATDVALITALYVILASVNRHLALLAAFFSLVGCAIQGFAALFSLKSPHLA